jgi:hypothetical protein
MHRSRYRLVARLLFALASSRSLEQHIACVAHCGVQRLQFRAAPRLVMVPDSFAGPFENRGHPLLSVRRQQIAERGHTPVDLFRAFLVVLLCVEHESAAYHCFVHFKHVALPLSGANSQDTHPGVRAPGPFHLSVPDTSETVANERFRAGALTFVK